MSTERDGQSAAPGGTHTAEPHSGSVAGRLNWLRAGVLGANDGVISTAGLVIGVAAATTSSSAIATAGIAGLTAGAVSMALGEYVSVSTQRDTEKTLVEKERLELEQSPKEEHAELVELLRERGLSAATSLVVADELSEADALRTHLTIELGIDQDEIAAPWSAALSSALAFTAGAAVPLLAILLAPASTRIAITFVAVLVGLAMTGAVSAQLGNAPVRRAVGRLVFGGAAAMAVTYAIGQLLGTTVA